SKTAGSTVLTRISNFDLRPILSGDSVSGSAMNESGSRRRSHRNLKLGTQFAPRRKRPLSYSNARPGSEPESGAAERGTGAGWWGLLQASEVGDLPTMTHWSLVFTTSQASPQFEHLTFQPPGKVLSV